MKTFTSVMDSILSALDGHDIDRLRDVAYRLKQSDGEGWAVGEMLERAIAYLLVRKADGEISEIDPLQAKVPAELLPFKESRSCAKCGLTSFPGLVYCNGCDVRDGIELIHEHLHRKCLGCGYVWLELCKDYAPEDGE